MLAEQGCGIGIAARRQERLDALAQEIRNAGGTVVAVAMYVSDRGSMADALDAIKAEIGTVEILFNNAGIAGSHGFLDAPEEETAQVFAVNQTAVWDVAQMASQRLVKAGKPGSIINIASITGLRAVGGASSYASQRRLSRTRPRCLHNPTGCRSRHEARRGSTALVR